ARVLIDDSYNANPESFSAAIQVLTAFTSKKILLMGDMLELDNKGEYYHKQIGRQAMLAGVDKLFCFGSLSKFAAESFGASAKFYECQDQLYSELLEMLAENWVILVKGSRSMNMEKLVVRLKGLTK
ncbi:MAG: cyanophycin synthetase, partial [Pseudomonadota bacterium]|nr:cyanophycin synthetase [Pseudomonadota bacterium]